MSLNTYIRRIVCVLSFYNDRVACCACFCDLRLLASSTVRGAGPPARRVPTCAMRRAGFPHAMWEPGARARHPAPRTVLRATTPRPGPEHTRYDAAGAARACPCGVVSQAQPDPWGYSTARLQVLRMALPFALLRGASGARSRRARSPSRSSAVVLGGGRRWVRLCRHASCLRLPILPACREPGDELAQGLGLDGVG